MFDRAGVVEITTGGDVGEQQVVAHHRLDHLDVVGGQSHPGADRGHPRNLIGDPSVAGSVEYTVLDYKGTTFQKALRYELATKWGTSTSTVARGLGSAFYRSASAVNRVDVNLGGGNTFVNNSVVSLYGRL